MDSKGKIRAKGYKINYIEITDIWIEKNSAFGLAESTWIKAGAVAYISLKDVNMVLIGVKIVVAGILTVGKLS